MLAALFAARRLSCCLAVRRPSVPSDNGSIALLAFYVYRDIVQIYGDFYVNM